MTIIGAQLATGATYTPSGGTVITWDDTGEELKNGLVLADFGEVNFFARRKLFATVRQPALQKDGAYSKLKVSVRVVKPYVLASGKVIFNLARYEEEIHPEAGGAVAVELKTIIQSSLQAAAYQNLYELGVLT